MASMLHRWNIASTGVHDQAFSGVIASSVMPLVYQSHVIFDPSPSYVAVLGASEPRSCERADHQRRADVTRLTWSVDEPSFHKPPVESGGVLIVKSRWIATSPFPTLSITAIKLLFTLPRIITHSPPTHLTCSVISSTQSIWHHTLHTITPHTFLT
jgi:hypothetical protein